MLQPRSLNLSNVFITISLYRRSLMLPRNFLTTSLITFHASSSISVIVSVKLSSIISLRICGPSNIPSLSLACDNEENFVHKYWKHGLFLANALTNCSSFAVWCARVEVEFFHGQQDLHSKHFWFLLAVAPFRANVQYPNGCPWPCYPTRIGKRKFCVDSSLSQQQSNGLQITAYLPLMLVVFNFSKHQL